VVKVIWQKTASRPRTDSSIVFARWRQCALSCGHIGATWRIRLNFASFGPPESTTQTAIRSLQPFLHSARQKVHTLYKHSGVLSNPGLSNALIETGICTSLKFDFYFRFHSPLNGKSALLNFICTWKLVLICHTSEPSKNHCIDRDAVWVEDTGGPKEPCIRWEFRSPMVRGNFEGEGASDCKV